MNEELISSQAFKRRGIEAEVLFEAIEEALVSAYKREFDAKTTENIRANRSRNRNESVFNKTVVDTVTIQCRDFERPWPFRRVKSAIS